MIINISWKNIWRSRTRSLIIMMAITLGIFGGIFMIAFIHGMTEQRLSNALQTEVSHLKVHHNKYQENNDFNMYMADVTVLEDSLKINPLVKSYSKRIIINSLASTAETGTGVQIIGIDPQNEPDVTNVNTKIIDGDYFEGIKRNPIVIGQKLADKLKVKVRSKIVVQVRDMNGNSFPASFRVSGIYKTNNSAFDEMTVFVHINDLKSLTGLNAYNAHEIAIVLHKRENCNKVDMQLGKAFPNYLVETWEEGNLILAYMNDAMDQYMVIFMIIILFALLFGIANTMLMAIHDRRKELAMLRAVGMSKFRVFKMITFESIFLSLVGAVIGIIIGMVTVLYFSKNGLNLSLWSTGLESIGYDPIVYFQFSLGYLALIVFMVFITGIIASIIPSVKAITLKPSEALRIE